MSKPTGPPPCYGGEKPSFYRRVRTIRETNYCCFTTLAVISVFILFSGFLGGIIFRYGIYDEWVFYDFSPGDMFEIMDDEVTYFCDSLETFTQPKTVNYTAYHLPSEPAVDLRFENRKRWTNTFNITLIPDRTASLDFEMLLGSSVKIDLCAHAGLTEAHVFFSKKEYKRWVNGKTFQAETSIYSKDGCHGSKTITKLDDDTDLYIGTKQVENTPSNGGQETILVSLTVDMNRTRLNTDSDMLEDDACNDVTNCYVDLRFGSYESVVVEMSYENQYDHDNSVLYVVCDPAYWFYIITFLIFPIILASFTLICGCCTLLCCKRSRRVSEEYPPLLHS